MNIFMTAYGFPILGLLILGLAFWLFSKKNFWIFTRRQRREAKQPEETPAPDNAPVVSVPDIVVFLFDDGSREIHEHYNLPGSVAAAIKAEYGNLGKQLNVEGAYQYCITKTTGGSYRPAVFPETMEHPPSEVVEAIQNPDVDIFFDVQMPKSFMQQWGPTLLFVGFIVFIMWTVVMK